MTTAETRQARLDVADGIPGWMARHELEWLHDTAASLPHGAIWVEVGSWCGRSFYAVASGLPSGSRLIGVDSYVLDVPSTPKAGGKVDGDRARQLFAETLDQAQRDFPTLTLELREGDSLAEAGHVTDGSVDVVFIDACHKDRAVMADIDAWRPKLRPGGRLCGHDYSNADPGVILAVDDRLGGIPGLEAPAPGAGSIWSLVV